MFCSTCGKAKANESAVCESCSAVAGTFESISAPVPNQLTPIQKFLKNKRLMLIAGASGFVLLVTTVIVLVFMPRPVELVVGVSAPYGGVFEGNCQISADGEALVPTSLVIKSQSTGKKVSSVILSYKQNASGDCVGYGTASVDPFGKFELFQGEDLITSIGSDEISAGKAEAFVEAPLFRTINVKFALFETADSCSGSIDDWYCSWDNDYVFGLDLDSDEGTCKGKSGYSDIKEGTNVTVKGNSNGTTSSGSLSNDGYDLVSTSSREIKCNFYSNIYLVPNDPVGYAIEVGNRGEVSFSNLDLISTSWEAAVNLGKD